MYWYPFRLSAVVVVAAQQYGMKTRRSRLTYLQPNALGPTLF
jgi:hypothetical protein